MFFGGGGGGNIATISSGRTINWSGIKVPRRLLTINNAIKAAIAMQERSMNFSLIMVLKLPS
jgi:hypothetical protein